MYWAMTTITTVGFGDVVAHSDQERVVAMIALVFGTGFFSYVIGSVSSIVASTDTAQRAQMEKMSVCAP